ncbi:MAG: hypothetical protein HYV09_02045 [Deltaproteobacteria bacterium]|nr:hypothetical protein [Deltaproteobacteria bacterium]
MQVSSLRGGASIHYAGREASTPFARYAAALRDHVEEVHAIVGGGTGLIGAALRGAVNTVTRFGPTPSILHADVDALVEDLWRRHRVEPADLRACIARVG